MIASFDHELGCALEMLDDNDRESVRDVSVATGEAAYDFICSCLLYTSLFKFRLERERRECEKRRKVFLAVSGYDDPRQRRIRFKREYGVVGAVAEKNAQIEPCLLYTSLPTNARDAKAA